MIRPRREQSSNHFIISILNNSYFFNKRDSLLLFQYFSHGPCDDYEH